jgi:hypothetical protein
MAAASPGAGSVSGTRNGNAITPTLAVAAQWRGSKRLATGASPKPQPTGRKAESDGEYQYGQDAKEGAEAMAAANVGRQQPERGQAEPKGSRNLQEHPNRLPGPISRRALRCLLQPMTRARHTRQGHPNPPCGPAAIGLERQQGEDGQPRQQPRHQAHCRPITGNRRTFRYAQAAQAPRSSHLESAGRRIGYSP